MPLRPQNGINASGQRVTNLATPTTATDAATMAYVDLHANVPVFVQQAAPSTSATVYEWYQLDASGNLVGHWLYP